MRQNYRVMRERVTFIFVTLVLFLTTIPRASNFYSMQSSTRVEIDVILVFIAITYCMVVSALFILDRKKLWEHKVPTTFEIVLCTYAVCGVVVTFFSRVSNSLLGWLGIFTGNGALSVALVSVVVILIGRASGQISRYTVLVFIFLLFQDLIIFLQLAGCNPFGLYGESDFYATNLVTNQGGNYAGTLGNIGPLSNILGMLAVALGVLSFDSSKSAVQRLFCVIISILTVLATLMLGTDAVLVGYTAVAALLLFCVYCSRHHTILPVCLVALATVAVASFAIYHWDGQSGLLFELHEMLHGNISDDYGSGRVHIWKDFLSECKNNLIIGKGLDSAGFDILGYFEHLDEATQVVYKAYCVDGHSKWINILYGGGLLTLLPYVLYFVLLFASLMRKYNVTQDILVLVCICATGFWVVVWSVSISYMNTDCIFYVMLGLSHSVLLQDNQGQSAKE